VIGHTVRICCDIGYCIRLTVHPRVSLTVDSTAQVCNEAYAFNHSSLCFVYFLFNDTI
jgi:hypothetical protein